jgi:demethylmenaquinone methyltransferase/2-methoxy-6-polyprenyl-1,4-benzoquinol methylase
MQQGLPSPDTKRSYVRSMFAAIAPRYDLMNRLMTFGRDQVWRRTVVRLCHLPQGGRLLDVATGTGDIGYEALAADPTTQVIGLDLTREMMLAGRGKRGLSFPFVQGDALALPFPTGSFDAVCSGFMMRNVTDIRAAFAEQRRVIRPGGHVVCLEITRPAPSLFRVIFDLYFFRLTPLVGGIISGQPAAYRYLPASTVAFPRPPALAAMMEEVGLRHVRHQMAMMSTVAIHWGIK